MGGGGMRGGGGRYGGGGQGGQASGANPYQAMFADQKIKMSIHLADKQ
jgi:hypothetical protein